MNTSTAIVMAALIIIVIFSVKSYCKKLSSGCCGAGGDTVKKIKPMDRDISNYPHEEIIHISGMTCKNCAARIENAFNSRGGFYAKVDLSKKTANVYLREAKGEQILKDIVKSAGYTADWVEKVK